MIDLNKKPKLSIIVAQAENRAIGLNGDMPWHLSGDLKRFKALTMGHPVVMGRRTWELDQPSLTTRMWPGKSPERLILSSGDVPLEEKWAGFQSVLVEGGAQTLQSFINADLWDEAFVERSEMVLGDGVKAPELKTDPKGRPVHVNFA